MLFKGTLIFFIISVVHTGCRSNLRDTESDREEIISVLDSFNMAASKADYDNYFKYFTKDAIFIGTDAGERWNKKDFMIWAKPYFERGKTWDFMSLGRHIFFDKNGELAWFDELLNTQMKICRGSGVLIREQEKWKIQQYVLSMTIPNAKIDEAINLKSSIEDSIILKLKK